MGLRLGRTIAVIIALGALAGAGYWGWLWYQVPTVETVRPVRGPAVQAVYATGIVEPVHWAKVTPFLRGRIAMICNCEGKAVRKGELLARLDDREARADIAALEAREKFLANEVKRYSRLLERRVTSTQAYERASSDHAQVRAAIRGARQRVGHHNLRAPMDGMVLRTDGEVGEIAEPGQVLFWVGKPKPLWVVGEVDEEDIPLVRIRQSVLIKADAFPDRALDGTVARITPKGDPITKNYRVRIALPPSSPLMIGMTTELNVIVQKVENALLVPAEALTGDHVWEVREGRAFARKVTVGIRGAERVQIIAGLGEDDAVILAPAGLSDGARVRLVAPPGGAP